MNPAAQCPRCKKTVEFHDEEMDSVADGSGVCTPCRLEIAEAGYIMGIATGEIEPPEGLPDPFERRDDNDE